MPVVTIAREFGAGGETVGRMLADRLEADLVDSRIIDEVARRLEIPQSEVEAADEDPASLVERLVVALGASSVELSSPPEIPAWTPPYADPALDVRKAVLQITQEVIREAARSGNAVIVGRGAVYVLQDEPEVTHVFLQAPIESRVPTVMELFGCPAEQARQRIKRTDANRAAYVKQVYGEDWRDFRLYDLALNTARLGYESATEAVLAAVARRSVP